MKIFEKLQLVFQWNRDNSQSKSVKVKQKSKKVLDQQNFCKTNLGSQNNIKLNLYNCSFPKKDESILFEHLRDKVVNVGTNLEKMPFVDFPGNELRNLEKIYEIQREYVDRLSQKQINELRKLWNMYVLREKACQCLAFFDKQSFGLGNEQKRIRSSSDLYFPSPDEVFQLSKEVKFEQKMKLDSNDRTLEQFNVLFKNFESSYQKHIDGEWLKWDLPKIISRMQVQR